MHALCCVGAVEKPQRLHKQAAQGHEVVRVIGLQLSRTALHKGHVSLAVPQQLQVVRRALAGQQYHINPVDSQCLLVALAKLFIGTLGRAGGQGHRLGGIGVEPPIGQHQQPDRQEGEGARRHNQIAQGEKGVAKGLGHGGWTNGAKTGRKWRFGQPGWADRATGSFRIPVAQSASQGIIRAGAIAPRISTCLHVSRPRSCSGLDWRER